MYYLNEFTFHFLHGLHYIKSMKYIKEEKENCCTAILINEKLMMMMMMVVIIINIFHGQMTLHVAQIVNTEQLQYCIPWKHGLFQAHNCEYPA